MTGPKTPRFGATLKLRPLIILTTAMAAATSVPAHAQSQSGTAVSTVLNSLSVANTTDLDFGTLVAGTTAGTVTIAPASGARTTTGGVAAAGGSPGAATFVATGVINRLYLITLPSVATVLTNGTGGTMTVTNFAHDAGFLPRFLSGPVATIHVGGRLNVGANQADGNYSGTFNLTVIYL